MIFNNDFHDRYFIIDEKRIYHCGSSINRIGYKTFSINLISDRDVCISLIDKINTIIWNWNYGGNIIWIIKLWKINF